MAEAGIVTHSETNTTVQQIVDNQPKEKPRVTVVTPDNFDEYVNEKMGIDPEANAKAEHAKVEAEKAARKASDKAKETDVETEEGVSEHLPKDKKGKLNERFSELTKARKEAEERATQKESEAKTEREARAKAEEEAAALKAKYEPVKTDPDPEPQPSQFTDVNEYAKALKEWTADNTRREDAKKAEADKAAKAQKEAIDAWNARQDAYKAKNPDYEKKLSQSSVKVSDLVRDAIIDSEVGPQILEHLADNPDVADKIGQMTGAKALKEIGRLEATLSGGTAQPKVAEVKTHVAEISKAPAPISPLKGADAPVVRLSGTDPVPSSMSYEDWKKMRQAGKIK